MSVSRQVAVINWKNGAQSSQDDEVAAEVPVALTYNKRSHVVMMVTPTALEDFAIGFSLTEGIINQPPDILDITVLERENGLEAAMTINEDCQRALLPPARHSAVHQPWVAGAAILRTQTKLFRHARAVAFDERIC